MALNFGVLDQGGPSNFFEGYSQGQEKMQANAMAQQKNAQAQQEFGMRQQEFAAGQADKQRAANTAMVTQKTLAARDALLRAPNPEAARAIVRAQHADPHLGPVRGRFGTLEQDLAEIPDEPTAFQQYKEREAMGAEAFLKQQASSREFASAMGGAQAMPQAAPTNAMAPAGTAAPAPMANAMVAPAAPANAMVAPAVSGELQNLIDQRKRLALIANQDPRVKANIDILDKEIARLSPAAPTTPASVSEYNFAVQQGYKGSLFDFKRDLANAGRAAGTTVVMPVQEKAEKGERGKFLVEQYKGVSDAARNASRTLPALETQAAILDSGFKTGFGTDVQKAGASLLGALGVPEAAKFATDSQKFLGAAQQAVLQKQLEQKGPQTEADAQRISQTGAQLGNTVEANRFMIDVAKSQLKRDVEQRNFYDGWWKKNNTYDGAEDAWFSGEGGKSLFARAELKKYVAPVSNKPAAAGGLSSAEQAELDQLRKQVGGKK